MKTVKPVALALICALLLTGMYGFSKERIELNKRIHAERTLRQMIDRDDIELIREDAGYVVHHESDVYARIRELHTIEGYNGHIGLYLAVDTQGNILSVRVFDHEETPGLGDKIDRSVSSWIDVFAGHSLTDTSPGDWDVTKHGGRFDAITGATITSRATVRAVYLGLLREESTQ